MKRIKVKFNYLIRHAKKYILSLMSNWVKQICSTETPGSRRSYFFQQTKEELSQIPACTLPTYMKVSRDKLWDGMPLAPCTILVQNTTAWLQSKHLLISDVKLEMQDGIYSSQWQSVTSRDQSKVKKTYKKPLRLQILFADINLFLHRRVLLAFRPWAA